MEFKGRRHIFAITSFTQPNSGAIYGASKSTTILFLVIVNSETVNNTLWGVCSAATDFMLSSFSV